MRPFVCIAFCTLIAATLLEISAGEAQAEVLTVVDTDNRNPCREDDPLAIKYRNSVVYLSGQGPAGGYANTRGILIDHCSKLLTAAHVFFAKDQTTPLKNLSVISPSALKNEIDLKRPVLREGPWRATRLFKDEVALVDVPRSRLQCAATTAIAEVADVRDAIETGKIDVYILKINDRHKICAQKCNSPRWLDDGLYEAGTMTHDCPTAEGDSGSPIFGKARGHNLDYLVGVHTGPHSALPKTNIFAPFSNEMFKALAASPPTDLRR